MAKNLIIRLHGGVGASLPNDPVEGRFFLRGTVIGGVPKGAIGRKVDVVMTKAQLQSVVNNGASALLRHPKCGSTPKDNQDG